MIFEKFSQKLTCTASGNDGDDVSLAGFPAAGISNSGSNLERIVVKIIKSISFLFGISSFKKTEKSVLNLKLMNFNPLSSS